MNITGPLQTFFDCGNNTNISFHFVPCINPNNYSVNQNDYSVYLNNSSINPYDHSIHLNNHFINLNDHSIHLNDHSIKSLFALISLYSPLFHLFYTFEQ